MLKIKKTKFKDLLIISGKTHYDKRGFLREMLLEKIIKKKFKLHIVSSSKKGVLRGLHFQSKNPQGKYVSVIKGEILDVAVDIRKKSKTFGKKYSIILSSKNNKSIYIPPGFAHGFLCLGKENIVAYSCTNYRSIGHEYSLLYKDKKINVKWPLKKIIITDKDKNAKTFNELLNKFKSSTFIF